MRGSGRGEVSGTGEIERDRDWDWCAEVRLLWWSVCDFDFFFLRDLLLTGLLGEEEAWGEEGWKEEMASWTRGSGRGEESGTGEIERDRDWDCSIVGRLLAWAV